MEYRGHAKDFGEFLDRTVGKVGYLIGTRGIICTKAMINYRLKSTNYRKYWNTISKYAEKWVGKIVVDCMGWLEMWWNGGDVDKPVTEHRYPDTLTAKMYALAKAEKLPHGGIGTLPKNCPYPIAVGYDGHVGFYYKGIVYQSAGHAAGTVKTPLNETKYNHAWKYWYYIPYLNYGEDVMLERGNKGKEVYDYQHVLQALGYDLGTFEDMKTGAANGCDGVFGGYVEDATKEAQKKYGLEETGKVDAALYGALSSTLIQSARVTQQQYSVTLQQYNKLKAEVDKIKAELQELPKIVEEYQALKTQLAAVDAARQDAETRAEATENIVADLRDGLQAFKQLME